MRAQKFEVGDQVIGMRVRNKMQTSNIFSALTIDEIKVATNGLTFTLNLSTRDNRKISGYFQERFDLLLLSFADHVFVYGNYVVMSDAELFNEN